MTTALVDKTPLRQVTEVRFLLSNMQAGGQLQAVAAKHMTAERMMRLLALAIDKTPAIGKCTPLSVLGALMTCASLGLEPNTVLNHAYIIPRKDGRKSAESRKHGGDDVFNATLQIGYRGYIQLGHNSGQVSGLDAGVHYSDDIHWKYMKGAKGVLEHEPGPEKGEKLHAYAVVNLANGNSIWVCWPWEKVIAHRNRYSDAYKNAEKNGKYDSPWHTNEDAMAMKTMIRQVAKWMPMSSEIVQAASLDGARANYADFAMNPSAGLPSPDEAEDTSGASEAEIVDETDDAPVIEDKTPVQNPAETGRGGQAQAARPATQARAGAAAPKANPAPGAAASTPPPASAGVQAAREKAAAAVAERKAAAQAAPPVEEAKEPDPQEELSAADEAYEKYRGWANQILSEIDTSGDARSTVLDLWAPEIVEIRANAPALADEIDAYQGSDDSAVAERGE